jgi:hypothetical protein
MQNKPFNRFIYPAGVLSILLVLIVFVSCHSRKESKLEQISVNTREYSDISDTSLRSIQGNAAFNQIATRPNSVIMTGLPEHRLVTIYKSRGDDNAMQENTYSSRYSEDYYTEASEGVEHFMPGIEILYGYYLLNIAHYDLKTGKLNYFFEHPTLVKILYYPSFEQDSIDKKPITRNYYLVSVYDEDTNKDTLINRKDLRRFYCFNADCTSKTQLIPADYSVMRSQYDSKNDIMYIFAKQDANKNGTGDKNEPVHVFWIDLKLPQQAKRLY